MTDTEQARIKRINVAVNADMLASIDRVIAGEEVTLTEAVRRLIAYGDFVYRTVRQDRATLLIQRENSCQEIRLL